MKKLFKKYKKHLFGYFAIVLLIFACGVFILYFRTARAKQIYPNIYIGELNFGGKNKTEAIEELNKKTQNILNNNALIDINGKKIDVGLTEYSALDPDLSREIIKIDLEKTVDKLYSVGKHPLNPLQNLFDIFEVLYDKKQMTASIHLDKNSVLARLQSALSKYETPKQNATLSYIDDLVIIAPESSGLIINYDDIINDIQEDLKNLKPLEAQAEFIADYPDITIKDIAGKEIDAQKILTRAPFTLQSDTKKWTISKEDLKKYLGIEKTKKSFELILLEDNIEPLFAEISKALDAPAREAKFAIKNGKVSEFTTSRLGVKVNRQDTLINLNKTLLDGATTVRIITKIDEPKITTSDANDLGISDLLGTGISDFTGSPVNRRHNIKVGAEKLNGIIIKPNEEFSLIKALGEINDEAGFKPELVIKGDRTIPEFGGGLCQIGTTTFRGALSSGLPITERRNHSYRVAYYEPAGTDATIYDPAPDFKFLNDTPGHILILTRIEGDKLFFDFWGKKDGREVTQTTSTIYNITTPPSPKYIVTTELAPGVKKKVESAHNGATAYFDYTVKYTDDRDVVEKRFYSVYRPWAETWLIGATSTIETTSSN